MQKTSTICFSVLAVFLLTFAALAQGPVPLVTPALVDSGVYNGIYRGGQAQLFCEPASGNLVSSWYRYYSGQPDPRRITAGVSTDNGVNWTIYPDINLGVGTEMNARYPSVWGVSGTPIIGYADRNPTGANQDSRPVVAIDVLNWNGGLLDNRFVDNTDSPDTVLYARYVSVGTAPDNENLWLMGAYHSAAPGGGLYVYKSADGGNTWSRPRVVASEIAADSGMAHWVKDVSSTGCGVGVGTGDQAMAVGAALVNSADGVWSIIYSLSSDGGNTWSPIAPIPGTESLNFSNSDVYRPFRSPFMDKAGNWHIFTLGVDTLEDNGFPQPYRAWDYKYDGSSWTITKFCYPSLIDNGLAARGDYGGDIEQDPLNEPVLGPDGTLYYVYSDVVDTTGSGGNEAMFNYNMFVVYSEDNGASWSTPVSILDQWKGRAPSGAALYATDKVHVTYRKDNDNPNMQDEYYYMGVPTATIKQIATAIGEPQIQDLPTAYSLHQNFPNPFNPTTTIRFDLKQSGHVKLNVYNTLGQEVATLLDQNMDAGHKGVVWDATEMPSGVYFYTLEANDYIQTNRMVLLK